MIETRQPPIEPPHSGRDSGLDLHEVNRCLEQSTAEQRVAWAVRTFGDRLILSSSFGVQSAVCLHMVSLQKPDIPVVLIDTGYLFPETYRFIDQLVERFSLNLKVFRPGLTSAWQEARYGKRWEQGLEGIEQYNQMNKVAPMRRALRELKARGWIAGLRRQQSESRRRLPVVAADQDCLKVHPIIDWSNKDVHRYLVSNDLPYHPLWHQGYLTVGDVHTTRPVDAGMSEEEARFFGLKRECGLHEGVQTDFSI